VRVEVYDITRPELNHSLGRFLVTAYAEQVNDFIESVDISDSEVGLVYYDGKLADILRPGSFRLYWKGLVNTEVKVIDIAQDYAVDEDLLAVLVRSVNKSKDNPVYSAGVNAVFYVEVPDSHVGLLLVNGKLTSQLKPGSYGYWRFNRNIEVSDSIAGCRTWRSAARKF
jgi:hypothetical protein